MIRTVNRIGKLHLNIYFAELFNETTRLFIFQLIMFLTSFETHIPVIVAPYYLVS